MFWLGAHQDFWYSILLSAVLIVAFPVWRKLRPKGYHMDMGWMDWCGYYFLRGIVVTLIGGMIDSRVVMGAGVWLMCGLYPIAILGLLGKVEDFRVTLMRAWRER